MPTTMKLTVPALEKLLESDEDGTIQVAITHAAAKEFAKRHANLFVESEIIDGAVKRAETRWTDLKEMIDRRVTGACRDAVCEIKRFGQPVRFEKDFLDKAISKAKDQLIDEIAEHLGQDDQFSDCIEKAVMKAVGVKVEKITRDIGRLIAAQAGK